MIKAAKWHGLLAIKSARPALHGDILRHMAGSKWSKKYNCIFAEWTSFSCAKLLQLITKFGWDNPEDTENLNAIYEAARPVYEWSPHLFPELPTGCTSRQFGEAKLAAVEPLLKRKPWAHQREAFIKLCGMTGAVLDMGMGTGKTMTSIAMILSGPRDFGLIVCPKSVVDVWPLEFFKNSLVDFHLLVRGKESIQKFTRFIDAERHNAKVYRRPFAIVVNYEAMWQGALGEFLKKQALDYIIFDEVHRLKSEKRDAKASMYAAGLRRNARKVIGCSGTLLPHSPKDAFGVFKSIDPGIFGTSIGIFKAHYVELGGFEGKQIVGFKNQQEMYDLIKSVSYRVKTEDAIELPPFQHIERKCELSAETRRVYNQMASEMLVEFEDHILSAANAMVKVLRLMQITSGVMKDVTGSEVRIGSEKAELFGDIIEDLPLREPIVIFCNFTADIKAVKEACVKSGRTVSELSGQKNELASWQRGETDALAVQIRAGKEGVDFTRACIAFYYSIGHSYGDYEQSLKRPHRPGQTRPVVYYHLVAKDTIDETIYKNLDKKRDIVLSVLEGIGLNVNNQTLITLRSAVNEQEGADKDERSKA